MKSLDNKKISFLEKIFLILVFLQTGTALTIDFSFLGYLIITIFILMIIFKKISFNNAGRMGLFIIVMLLFYITQVIFNESGSINLLNLLKHASLFAMVFLYASSKVGTNRLKFNYIIRLIVLFSLISNTLFVLYLFGFNLPITNTIVHNSTSVFYLLTIHYDKLYGIFNYRNGGIYWEPGMYQIYLNLAIIYFLYEKNLSSKKRILILTYLVVSVISTGSITGYFLCVAIFILYTFFNNKSLVTKILLGTLAIVSLVVVLPYLGNMYEVKLTTASYDHRSSDLNFGFRFFLTNPITGYGPNSDAYYNAYLMYFGSSRGNTNGLVSILIDFGLIGAIIYTYLFIAFISFFSKSYGKNSALLIISWLVLSFLTEPINTHTLIYFILAIGMANRISVSNQNNQLRRNINGK